MLDSDLAKLYECTNGTKTINQTVNRHLERFPNDFYFQLTEERIPFFGVAFCGFKKWFQKMPYVFTEYYLIILDYVCNYTNIILDFVHII